MAGGKRVHRGGSHVVPKDARQDVEEHALAVSARSVDEHECVLAGDASETVATELLQEADELDIAAGGVMEEFKPKWTFFVERRDCGQLCNRIFPPAFAQLACAQINGAAWRAEQPRVRVPILMRHSN